MHERYNIVKLADLIESVHLSTAFMLPDRLPEVGHSLAG